MDKMDSHKMPGTIYHKDDGTLHVDVPVTYEMADVVHMKFDSEEDMMEKLNDPTFVELMDFGEDGQYIDGSYAINMDFLTEFLLPYLKEHEPTE